MDEAGTSTTGPVWWKRAGVRLFLTCWVVFGLHFATNVVREHYPAMALADHGSLQLDDYAGLHDDIFEFTDGHSYINNQVTTSVIAAPALVLTRPVLDALQAHSLRKLEETGPPPADYDTVYPERAKFYKRVRELGLELKLGAVTAITAGLVMAPLTAWMVILVWQWLLARGLPERTATWYAALFAFGTPVFYRVASLNHNQLTAVAAFASFTLLRPQRDGEGPTRGRLLWSGFFAGWTLALDYSGVIPLLALFGYVLWTHGRRGGVRETMRAGSLFVVGTFAPVGLLWFTQWAQFGNPFLPAQAWMPAGNEHAGKGFQGMSWPAVDLIFQNLFDPDWGVFAFGPLLLLGVIPSRLLPGGARVFSRTERGFMLAFFAAFLLFSSANQFARLQWNTGFRYFAPVVPFVFLAAVDALRAMPARAAAVAGVLAVVWTWALSMVRYTPPLRGDTNALIGTWERLLDSGPQLPWHTVLTSTSSFSAPLVSSPWFPAGVFAVTGVLLVVLWRGAVFSDEGPGAA